MLGGANVQAELAQDERAAAELAGVTWHPEISKMAQTMQRRDADEDSFMRLTRPRTNKTQVMIMASWLTIIIMTMIVTMPIQQ